MVDEVLGYKYPNQLKRKRGFELNPAIGDRVKICAEFEIASGRFPGPASRASSESFWVKVTWFFGDIFRGIVDNDLVYSAHHGLKADDKVAFNRCDILEIEGENE